MTFKDRLLKIILWISKKTIPIDFFSQRHPISIKGVIICDDKVLLLKNERDEWDLPGGKLRFDTSPEACVIREVKEETNLDVEVEKLEGSFIYNIRNFIKVFIVVYSCTLISEKKDFKISGEHFDGRFFSLAEIEHINIYKEYKEVIQKVFNKK